MAERYQMKQIYFMAGVLLLGLLTGCSGNDSQYSGKIIKQIETVTQQQKTEVTAGEIFDFSWDEAYIFKPYTTKETVQECLGQKVSWYRQSVSDSDILIYFKNQGEIVYCMNGSSDTWGVCMDYNFQGEYFLLTKSNNIFAFLGIPP